MALKLNLTVDGSSPDSLLKGARQIVQHVRPEWPQDQLKFKVYTAGFTNHLVGVWCGDTTSQVLVRVYGSKTEMFIDRDTERRTFEVLHRAGCGPALYAVFDNGLSYGFTQGVTLTATLVTHQPVWRAITKHMAKYHKIKEGDLEHPVLFPKMRSFLSFVPVTFEGAGMQMRIDACGYSKHLLSKEIDELEEHLTGLGCPVVFSHNDLLLANIVWEETTSTVGFIDYEYGGTNYQPFDIGNHFSEFAGVEKVDYSWYPCAEFQRQWLRSYLSHYREVPEEQVPDIEVELWYTWTNKFALASHLLWGTWAMVQATCSSIDFDYLGYGITRINEYFKRKDEFLSLTAPTSSQ
ncbi:ethanolamine kinase 1 [Procambarus clarkii]|uniref:ethanolamine kinase 1 n=1 Tax=Procambarus clarkii TaxID=6728 RepID=UPI0037424FDF